MGVHALGISDVIVLLWIVTITIFGVKKQKRRSTQGITDRNIKILVHIYLQHVFSVFCNGPTFVEMSLGLW